MLAEGPVRLDVDGLALTGDGRVSLTWHPDPDLRLELNAALPGPMEERRRETIAGKNGTMTLLEDGGTGSVFVSRTSFAFPVVGGEVEGHVRGIKRGDPNDLTELVFHVVNFVRFVGEPVRDGTSVSAGRLTLAADAYEIALDEVPNQREVLARLRRRGGFAITHVGRVKRGAGGRFDLAHAKDRLEDLFYVLSFARGGWCGLGLTTGRRDEDAVYQDWSFWKSHRWRGHFSWFPERKPDVLQSLMTRLLDVPRGLRGAIFHAITYCVEAHNILMPEIALVVAQSGLELLHKAMVEARRIPAPTRKKDATDKRLRALLVELGIPLHVPASATELEAAAKVRGWNDGPKAVATMRNMAAHSSVPNELFEMPLMVKVGGLRLALWYLELSVLSILGYDNEYQNTMSGDEWAGRLERVPWAPPSQTT